MSPKILPEETVESMIADPAFEEVLKETEVAPAETVESSRSVSSEPSPEVKTEIEKLRTQYTEAKAGRAEKKRKHTRKRAQEPDADAVELQKSVAV